MTVIVYRDGVMAADTASFMGSLLASFDEQKIHRTPSGHLVGCAGSKPEIAVFRAWSDGGFDPAAKPGPFKNFGALTVSPEGGITKYDQKCQPYRVDHEWAVEGCEEEFLYGVLAMGADARQAVELAIRYSAWAAGRVVSVSMTPQVEGRGPGRNSNQARKELLDQ